MNLFYLFSGCLMILVMLILGVVMFWVVFGVLL